MKKILIIPFLLFVYILSASPINERGAREIALEFFNGTQTRTSVVDVELEWAGNDIENQHLTKSVSSDVDNALIYIYNRSDGKGFVIVAGDDNVRPIIAYSRTNTFDVENIPDGARFILSGWCRQVEAAKVSQSSADYSVSALSEGTPVVEYPTALWGQGEPFNRLSPKIEGERSLTGCVATAMSIVAHYKKWPEKGVGTTPAYQSSAEGVTIDIPANDISNHTYDYENMLSKYQDVAYTDVQGNAVATLMYDMGTAVKMNYSPSASGATDMNSINAFVNHFQYSKSALLLYGNSYSDNEWIEMLKNNLRDYGPTPFNGVCLASGGHAFVLDGYDSNDYFRINYGWEGKGYEYYYIPSIKYSEKQSAIFYLEPDKSGTSQYRDNLTIGPENEIEPNSHGITSDATGYTGQKEFNVVLGRIYNNGLANFTGNIKVSLCDAQGNIKEDLTSEVTITDLAPGNYVSGGEFKNLKITKAISSGDRLRVYAKGGYSDSWKSCDKYNAESENEILVSATPEQIAESLYLSFAKNTSTVSFRSNMFLEYVVKNSLDVEICRGEVESNELQNIDMSSCDKGAYTFSFSSGGDPYLLTIVL